MGYEAMPRDVLDATLRLHLMGLIDDVADLVAASHALELTAGQQPRPLVESCCRDIVECRARFKFIKFALFGGPPPRNEAVQNGGGLTTYPPKGARLLIGKPHASEQHASKAARRRPLHPR
jgi:hypothetical protein